MIRILPVSSARRLLARRRRRLAAAERAVAPIVAAVRARGDAAVREYARRFDGFEGGALRVDPACCAAARARLAPALVDALRRAEANIRQYARAQLPRAWMRDYPGGRRLGQIVRPLASVGAYIPAGRYPLLSTLLMTVVPAQVAGVPSIVVACPRPGPEILGCCSLLGVEQVIPAGGAHAIAALAFGTRSIPRVERIVGPGSAYVAAAKLAVSGYTGVDFIAGPTEVVIIAAQADPACVAADLLAQAEHDPDAAAILLTPSRSLARAVARACERQLRTLPTAAVARRALARGSAIVLVASQEQALELANDMAPEHLHLYDPTLLPGVQSAGSVFLGPFSPEAAGDYATGPNHVLPTAGAARLRGGLSAADFVKVVSVQQLEPRALAALAPAITTLARAEGLEAHARAIEVRLA